METDWNGTTDRRQTPRAAFGANAWLEDDRGRRFARVVNVSAGGLVMSTAHALEPGSRVYVMVEGPAGHLSVGAEVRWVQQDDRASSHGVRMGMQVHPGERAWSSLCHELLYGSSERSFAGVWAG